MYDVIVVGGGHAGCEACLATSKMGFKTLLISGHLNMLGSMPCNPSIGGPAKGIVVREIDALGGYQGKNADKAQIQMKMLNSSKGPAVRALRSQEDKVVYSKQMRIHLESQENLSLKEGYVENLIIKDGNCCGIIMPDGEEILSKKVIITTGTYLNSKVYRGHVVTVSGPEEQKTSFGISKQLNDLGFDVRRLKTGTPPRIKASTIDYTKSSIEPGDKYPYHFSFDEGVEQINKISVPCHLTYTNKEIHNIIMDHLEDSAMYGGVITGTGPRYCPSIETKVVRFQDKERHQIFIEPESLEWDQMYIQGFSTSMPVEVQDKMIRLLPGFENCEVLEYAYAIEYDSINPLNLWPSLETKIIKNLYSAGQINGTSGYEEAACQGLMAGINCGLSLQGKEPLVLRRDEAYIGVLIDDLVTKGTDEPYRLLTSRAEYRLLLRHDNADLRLRKYGYEVGLISDSQYNKLNNKILSIENMINYLKNTNITKSDENNDYIESKGSSRLYESIKAYELLKRPEINYLDIKKLLKLNETDEVLEAVEIEAKYRGYIEKAKMQASHLASLDSKIIPDNINYNLVDNIALEAREKLELIRPKTIGQASRISGVNPADIAVLSVYCESLKRS